MRKEEGYDQGNRGLKYQSIDHPGAEVAWCKQIDGERNDMGVQGSGGPGKATAGRRRRMMTCDDNWLCKEK